MMPKQTPADRVKLIAELKKPRYMPTGPVHGRPVPVPHIADQVQASSKPPKK
jgi:hypothetical protein